MLENITKRLSNSFHILVRRNSAASVQSGLDNLTLISIPQQVSKKSLFQTVSLTKIEAEFSSALNSVRKMLMCTTAKRTASQKK